VRHSSQNIDLIGTKSLDRVRISIVVPTRARPALLARCLLALADQEVDESYEVIVVDDGTQEAAAPRSSDGLDLKVLRSFGRGPAVARNVGVKAARGEIVLFTDDDTVPGRGWVREAVAHLDAHPHHVGVEGWTTSVAFDPLYEHSIQSRGGHTFLTCNIAYRRETLVRLDGFFEGFPHPHCEDLDLGFRALQVGEIGTSPEMVVVHPPRDVSVRDIVRRGRLAASELRLIARHPDRYLNDGASPAAVVIRGFGLRWVRRAAKERRALVRSPRRAARFAVAGVGQVTLATVTVARDLLRAR
jgi:glycosyltransferase involved in cell wall biosynthesis